MHGKLDRRCGAPGSSKRERLAAAWNVLMAATFTLGCGACVEDTVTPSTPAIDAGTPDADASIGADDWYRPGPETTWQWQLQGTVNESYQVDLYDIDVSDMDSDPTLITRLQRNGHRVICYFSAGSSEDWRDDFSEFSEAEMGEPLADWMGERWLDIRSANVRRIMLARLDVAAGKGCDGVEPDNVDGYSNSTGFPLTADNQLDYNRFLATEAHRRGLAIGLKNDGDQAADLVDDFDFSLNEQCHEFEECEPLLIFLERGKPIFNVEYAEDDAEAERMAAEICPTARSRGVRTLILHSLLDDRFRYSCD
jgi:hypothetical protein